MKFHIGTSGWVYDDWQGIFYPKGLSRAKWFEFYNRNFTTVELNNSFYHLPSEKAFATWRAKSSKDFTYAVKATRFITHLKKLRNTEESLATFLERVQILGEKLGPLLYQLPPSMRRNEAVLESFVELLPNQLHHVIEFRNESWFDEAVFDLLRRNNIGFCIYDMPGFTTPLVVSADFAYLRFHGREQLYGSCYSKAEIAEWARKIAQLGQGLTSVYVYFNNDVEGFAVKNAKDLTEIVRKLVGEDRFGSSV
jgi:uncharacterized protein YecE (DUF72 family)